MHPIAQKIEAQFPEAFVEAKEALGELSLSIKREKVVEVCRFLHDTPELSFVMITDICSVDFPNETPRFEMIYQFYSVSRNHRIRIKARVPEEDCTIDSVTGIWKGADFMEREVYDMMGIVFNNHPDLRRILMTEDYDEGFPLRKDFPVEGRGWRDTFEFLEQE
ncbi:MAG: NADH-quinone oxidoreductase subunit C [Nitrospirae bacterium]|nr:NADH-quinone oxidoreductase subunit C [Candidatus Manganitrophaceae bacterium]